MPILLLAIFPSATNAESAITNLTEADIPEKDISLIMQDKKEATTIIDPGGPLKIASANILAKRLAKFKLPQATITEYDHAVQAGSCLLAVRVPKEGVQDIKEILVDSLAQHITTIT